MARMDPSLIGVTPPSIGNAFAQGQFAGQKAREHKEQNALNAFLTERGGDVMAGQPEAVNALARMGQDGFGMAQDIQARTEQRDHARERLKLVKAEATRLAEEHSLKMTAAQRAEARRGFEEALITVLPAFQSGEQAKLDQALADIGMEPVPLDEFPILLGAHEAAYEVWGRGQEIAGTGPEDSAAEQKIGRLVESGLDRNTAINIADGVWVTSQNPQTGEVQVIDKATGQPVQQQQAPQTAQAQPAQEPELQYSPGTFGEPFAASDRAFGLGGTLRGTVNAAGDAVGLGQAFPDVADTQRDFSVLRETLVNDLAGGYNRQPPSWLLKQIQELTPQAGSPLQGAEGAQDKLAALGRSVGQELQSISNQLNNRRLRPNLRQELEGQAASLQKVLQRVEQAHGSFGGGVAISPDVQERMRAYE